MSTLTQRNHRAAGGTRRAPGGQPPDLVPHLVLAAIAAGAAAVLALWWRDTYAVTGADQWLTGVGRITGLLAGYAAPVLLLLMARIPLLEREVGADRLARWHAMGGRYLVSLVAAHVLTIIWGYALTAHRGVVGEGVQVVFHYPGMIKGSLATLLMFGTGAVSARAARPRLSYETWYYLHLATYLAIALGFSHQLANGADLGGGVGQAGWYALYFGSFAVLGWYRLALPTCATGATGCGSPRSARRATGSCRSSSPGSGWPNCGPSPASSSASSSWSPACAGRPTPTRSPPHRTPTSCASRSRTWAGTAPRSPRCGRAYESARRVHTARSPRGDGGPAGCC